MKFFSELEKIGSDVKNFFVKAGEKAPAVLQAVAAEESQLAPVLEQLVPKSTSVVNTALSIADKVAQALEDGGPAAQANGLNGLLDQTEVSDIMAIVAASKAAAAKSAPPAPAGPAAPAA